MIAKAFHFSFLTALFLLSAASCLAQNPVTISGKIINPKSNKILINQIQNFIVFTETPLDSAELDAQGNFTLTFAWNHPGKATLVHGKEYANLYLWPGDNLHISLNAKEFDETLRFTGKGDVINNYLARKTLRMNKSIEDRRSATGLPENVFMRFSDSVLTSDLEFVKAYQQKQKNLSEPEKDFFSKENDIISYDWVRERLYYPEFHGIYHKKPAVKTSEEFAAPVLRLLAEKLADSLNPYYLKSTWNYTSYLTVIESIEKPELKKQPYSMRKYNKAGETQKGRVRAYQQTMALCHALIIENDFIGVEEAIENYRKENKNWPEYVKIADKHYKKMITLRPGKKAPDFAAMTSDGKPVSLSSFKGKVVYIDAWASWCGGCVAEIPAVKTLIDHFAGQDVVFLNVSIDQSAAAWHKALDKHGMKNYGVNAHASGGLSSDFALNYAISAIPQYILIDKEGNIISINAGRPRQTARQEIEAALKN